MSTITRTRRYVREPEKLRGFRLSEQDYRIVRTLGLLRVAASTHVDQLFPQANKDHLRRRLHQLYHRGFLRRVGDESGEQVCYHGSEPLKYALSEKGSRWLAELEGLQVRPADVRRQLPHALAIADFLAAMESGLPQSGHLSLLTFPLLLPHLPEAARSAKKPQSWPITVHFKGMRRTLHPCPDEIFAIATSKLPEPRNKRFFFLEIDRASMPVFRSDLSQTSILRKFLAYDETFRSKLHQERFGMDNVRVLFVTRVKSRVSEMIEVHQRHLGRLAGHYLFIDEATLYGGGELAYRKSWRNAQGEEVTLLPS